MKLRVRKAEVHRSTEDLPHFWEEFEQVRNEFPENAHPNEINAARARKAYILRKLLKFMTSKEFRHYYLSHKWLE